MEMKMETKTATKREQTPGQENSPETTSEERKNKAAKAKEDDRAKENMHLLTFSPAPHIRAQTSTRLIMLDVVVALLPALIWATYVFGWRVLALTGISVISCVLFELWSQLLLKRPVTAGDFSAVVTGILIAFNLPVTASLWVPIAGAFFAIVLVKQIFGGIGKNIVNPALAARVFIFISWPDQINRSGIPLVRYPAGAISIQNLPDAFSGATPLVSLKNGTIPNISLFDLVIGNCPGMIGEISALLLIAGGLYLLVRRVISWHIPVAYLATVAALTYFFPAYPLSHQFMLYELLSGGLILGAVFMATDYATSPMTKKGKLIYGVGCGAITVFIRYFGGYPEGVSFAILIMNLTVWYLDRYLKPERFGGRSRA